MKQTVFYSIHKALGARVIPFAGFEMPVEYTGVTEEHLAVRNSAGVFDVSHMGEIWIKGKGALDLIQKITTNDASKLTPGKIQYTCFPNGKGGIVDDLLVYNFSEKEFLLVVNASNIEKDHQWIVTNNTFQAEVENASDRLSQLAVQGPKALDILQQITDVDLRSIPYYTFKTGELAGKKDIILSNTGYTGAGGFELYFPNEQGPAIWLAIFEAGKDFGIKPVGLAARDTLRLEMGFALYGNDIDDTTSPIEAGLDWITKFTDYKNFIDKELLLEQKKKGIKRKLVGFEMLDKGIPRHEYIIVDNEGAEIGMVTSGTMSPTLKYGIGMGYVKPEFSAPGNEIYISIRNKNLKARVVKTPFVSK